MYMIENEKVENIYVMNIKLDYFVVLTHNYDYKLFRKPHPEHVIFH